MNFRDEAHAEQRLILEKWLGPQKVKGAILLTPREHDVCRQMIISGDNAYEKTASALGIEPSTVSKHITSVRTKIGFRSTMSMLLWLQRWYHLTDGLEQPLGGPVASSTALNSDASAAGTYRSPGEVSGEDGT